MQGHNGVSVRFAHACRHVRGMAMIDDGNRPMLRQLNVVCRTSSFTAFFRRVKHSNSSSRSIWTYLNGRPTTKVDGEIGKFWTFEPRQQLAPLLGRFFRYERCWYQADGLYRKWETSVASTSTLDSLCGATESHVWQKRDV